jgi:hypothetical protein
MFKGSKEKSVEKLEKELYVAHKRGYIFRCTHISEMHGFGDSSKIVGVEILFSDDVSVEAIRKIKTYIEKTYDFDVDNTTYMDVTNSVKIIIVRY